MTLKEAIDILEKELSCRNKLIKDAEYGVVSTCWFDCSACKYKYNTDSTEARDALNLVLEVVKSKEQQKKAITFMANEECKDLAKDGYNIEDFRRAQSKLYRKYVDTRCKPIEEYYEELIKSMRISGSLATPPTPVPPNDIPLRPKCMDCCKDD